MQAGEEDRGNTRATVAAGQGVVERRSAVDAMRVAEVGIEVVVVEGEPCVARLRLHGVERARPRVTTVAGPLRSSCPILSFYFYYLLCVLI